MHLETRHKDEATMPNRMGVRSKEFKKNELWLRACKKIVKYEHNEMLNNGTSYFKLCLIPIKSFSFKTISTIEFSYAKYLSSVGTGACYNHNTSKNMPKGSIKLTHQPNIQLMSSD